MSRYRQQLARIQRWRAVTAATAATPRRVRAGEPINAQPGEVLDVITTVEGTDMVIARVTAGPNGWTVR